MATATFYHPELSIGDTQIVLSEIESAHAVKSRRLHKGSQVLLINGCGLLAKGYIDQVDKQSVTVQIEACDEYEQAKSVSIAVAVPKGDRQRTMIDMLTQLGVHRLFPLNCDHSVTRYKQTMSDKWQRWAIEACKQSQNPWLPEIHPAISVDQALTLSDFVMAYADSSGDGIESLETDSKAKELLILIGPEGGFSERELVNLRRVNCSAIRLGQTILRTELAAVTALVHAL